MRASPAVGSAYSVGTFVVLAGAFVLGTSALLGWEPVPSDNRLQATVMLLWYGIAGWYSSYVGRHRDVDYPEALRRGVIDLGRAIKGAVMK
jgi:hypothetical protein